MSHLPNLIVDLALILGAAAIMTLIFKLLKQPLVLGYIIAGVLVSSHFEWFPSISKEDSENVTVMAEIGVIFLLFSLGLEFSFKKLAKVGGSSSVSAFVEAIGMSALGYGIGKMLGWTTMDAIYLGAALAVSSTTIIIKAVEELGLKKKKFATLVFGILIVEDLITIAILVLLTTISVTQQFDGMEMLLSVLKLIFFLILWFVVGIFFIPTILKKARKLMNDETLLIVSIAMCLLMVYLAAKVGFSYALGAFVMGSLLAETTKAERIEHLVKPVKDLFGAIFFVSVGMMIDLRMMGEYAVPILIITLACIVGKVITTGIGAYISGNSLKVSLQTGMSLAQIGEFSFILIALGISTGLVPSEGRDLIVAGALFSIMLNPLVFALVSELQSRVRAAQPAGAAFFGQPHYDALSHELDRIRARGEERTKAHDLKLHGLLEQFPVLSLVERQDQEALLLMFRPKSAAPGERVIRTGDRADGMYFISSGAVEVQVNGRTIRLEAGAYFGEMALLSGERRTADIVAVDFCQFLVLDRRDFNQFMSRHPAVRAAVAAIAEERREMNLARPQGAETETKGP